MKQPSITIQKDPSLPLAEDYDRLRAEGFTAIEELSSQHWTDYNAHDPGITLLEALTYALSELGYRTGFDIADILTERSGYISFRQALFTARRIMTNNPLTVNDFRKVLIDLDKIRNGWLLCKRCACETTFYAECAESALFHAPQWRLDINANRRRKDRQIIEHPTFVQGLYDVLLQLEEDPELGDLNNRKLIQTLAIDIGQGDSLAPLTIELRFPDWSDRYPEIYKNFVTDDPDFVIESVTVDRFSRDRVLAEPVSDTSFIQGWRNLFFVDYTIVFRVNAAAPVQNISITSIPIRFFSTREAVKRTPGIVNLVTDILGEAGTGGLVDRYRRKLLKTAAAVATARHALHNYRNLSEDYCRIQNIATQDIAFCADIDLSADADIEYILARVYFEIENHFNPVVPFNTLSEMQAAGFPTEAIFEGPALENGFIKDEDLEKAQLRSVIQVSDLYNLLMDIPGILAIKNVQFTRYDDSGQPETPAYQWKIPVHPLHLPKLYQEASRVLFYKDGLPFIARMDEMRAILAQLRGELKQGKVPLAEKDFPVPVGKFRELSAYEPVQHTLPFTYGIGPAGLNPRVSDLRKAQAKQLKGYLLPFEQLLVDMINQLSHAPDLFSTDENIDRSYFTHFFDPLAATPEIADYPNLVTSEMTEENLRQISESSTVFADRRNRFLDHMLARFGESFLDYALMLNANEDRIAFSSEKLIRDKIRFLRFYPRISRDRGRAFNYRYPDRWCDPRNRSGIAERISRLLGMEMLKGYFTVTISSNQDAFEARFELNDTSIGGLGLLLTEDAVISASTGEAAEDAAWLVIGDIIANSIDATRYTTNTDGDDILQDENGTTLARLSTGITPVDVQQFCSTILAKERLFVVEHLLLRPVFPGSPFMEVCLDTECNLCGEEDPYSFRLTYVLQGSLAPFSYDIDLRRFADLTIRKETPAHLLPKICWVGNIGLEKDSCAPIFNRLVALLQQEQDMDAEDTVTCDCANEIFDGFDSLFQAWMSDKMLLYRPESKWEEDLRVLFEPLTSDDFPCLTSDNGWEAIKTALLEHFIELAAGAYQFDRFEVAWCDWLEENSPFLWQPLTEQLQMQTERWVRSALASTQGVDVCRCAELILAYFGDRFRMWIDRLVEEEADLEDTAALQTQMETILWDAFLSDLERIKDNDPGFCPVCELPPTDPRWTVLRTLWLNTYSEWITVAYRLNVLLRIFKELKSIYPTATLHDCDDGSDDNPVRLDNTILGTL